MSSEAHSPGARSAPPSARAGSGRLPDFFIVGHHKSGTTAMYSMLRGHPQIFMPEMKEPEFFGRDLSRRRAQAAAARSRGRASYAQSRPQSYEEYLALFAAARPEQRVGEASPSYLGSPTAAGEIAELQPAARIVAILREPASFLHSLHLQMLQNHVQDEVDLGRALAADERRGEQAGSLYLARVRYVEQLRRYHEVFAPEQVLVLIYDDFRADNRGTVRRVLRLLDVDDAVAIEPVQANPTVAARSPALDRLVHAAKAGRGPVARTAKAVLPRRLRRRAVGSFQRNVVYGAAAAPDAATMRALRERCRGEVVALSEYLGRDLVALWGYDGIAADRR
ncbi:MAG TPA: sulfotransferase [Solirubrobacteraceae bacterium]|nr:sulfotransferase [Solirubrobacteraceae bacterium]